MKAEASVQIDAPVEKVFEVATTRVADWSTIVVSDEVVEEKPGGVGTRFRTTTEERGRQMVFDGVVTRHQPPTAHSVRMKGKQFDMDVDYAFTTAGGKTHVTQTSYIQAKGFTKVIFALFGWLMFKSGCDAASKELENLKRLVEEEGS